MDCDEILSDILLYIDFVDEVGWLTLSMTRIAEEIRSIAQQKSLPDDCLAWAEKAGRI